MVPPPPRSTRTHPPFPYPTLIRALARALNAAEMAELKPQKRYALAVLFIRAQHAQHLDDAADLFIRLMQNLENNARQKLLSRSEEHTSELQSLMRSSYAVSCLKKKTIRHNSHHPSYWITTLI